MAMKIWVFEIKKKKKSFEKKIDLSSAVDICMERLKFMPDWSAGSEIRDQVWEFIGFSQWNFVRIMDSRHVTLYDKLKYYQESI